jgi:hypothetical protein
VAGDDRGAETSTNPTNPVALLAVVWSWRDATTARIFDGDTRGKDKLVGAFEPSTEIIRKGNVSRPAALGKMVKLRGLPHRPRD